MSKQELISLLKEKDNDPPYYELEYILTEKELDTYRQIKKQIFDQRIESLSIDTLRFLLSNIIRRTPHIEDNKYLIECGLIDNEDDENSAVEMMLNKFTEIDIQNKIKIYKHIEEQ